MSLIHVESDESEPEENSSSEASEASGTFAETVDSAVLLLRLPYLEGLLEAVRSGIPLEGLAEALRPASCQAHDDLATPTCSVGGCPPTC